MVTTTDAVNISGNAPLQVDEMFVFNVSFGIGTLCVCCPFPAALLSSFGGFMIGLIVILGIVPIELVVADAEESPAIAEFSFGCVAFEILMIVLIGSR